jgi:hypothetical protein
MPFSRFAILALLAFPIVAADAPLPELHVEADPSGSVLTVKNPYSKALNALLIEIVEASPAIDFTRDELGPNAIAAGAEKKLRVTNTAFGETPGNVKIVAAIYEDGSTVGAPEKVNHILNLRRARLKNTREIIQRIEDGRKSGKDKDAIVADLRQWALTIVPPPPPGMQPITDPAKTMMRNMVVVTAGQVNTKGIDAELSVLKLTESELAGSKPAL